MVVLDFGHQQGFKLGGFAGWRVSSSIRHLFSAFTIRTN
jgi:hypothetical protein